MLEKDAKTLKNLISGSKIFVLNQYNFIATKSSYQTKDIKSTKINKSRLKLPFLKIMR